MKVIEVVKKYRKKLIVIEAAQLTRENFSAIERWIDDKCFKSYLDNTISLFISTLEGQMRANIGDFVIKGIGGEFYPCKADIFNKTYEDVAKQYDKNDRFKELTA